MSLIDLLKVRARTVHDIVRQAVSYFPGPIEYDQAAVAKQWKDREATAELLETVRRRLEELPQWDAQALEEALRQLAEERGVAAGKIFQPLRLALTGASVSPGIFDVLIATGRDLALVRLSQAVDHIVGG